MHTSEPTRLELITADKETVPVTGNKDDIAAVVKAGEEGVVAVRPAGEPRLVSHRRAHLLVD